MRSSINAKRVTYLAFDIVIFIFQKTLELTAQKTAGHQRGNSGTSATDRPQISDEKVTSSGSGLHAIGTQRRSPYVLRQTIYVRICSVPRSFTTRDGREVRSA